MKDKKLGLFSNKLAICFIIVSLFLLTIIIVLLCLDTKEELVKEENCEIEVLPTDNFVFLGDSITDFYPIEDLYDGLPVINSGVSGYKTTDILNNVEKMVSIYNPTKVILLIGTNDIEKGTSNDEIMSNINKIVDKILDYRPNVKIYIQSVYPVNKTDNDKSDHDKVGKRSNEIIQDLNKKIKNFCAKNKYEYINMYDQLVDNEDNLNIKYTTDGLHISDTGYLKITKVILKYLRK